MRLWGSEIKGIVAEIGFLLTVETNDFDTTKESLFFLRTKFSIRKGEIILMNFVCSFSTS